MSDELVRATLDTLLRTGWLEMVYARQDPEKGLTYCTLKKVEPDGEHTYPSAYPKGSRWSTDIAWEMLDQLKPGIIPEDVRAFIAGYMGGALESEREKADQIVAENTRLRAALAMSDQPCAYCILPADEIAKCESGFPGCARADDMSGCPELGARLERDELQREIELLKDPNAVHLNMLRGTIAKPSVEQIRHLYPELR